MIQALAYRVKKDIQSTLSYLLSQPYIIKELLQDLDQDTINEFVDKYVVSESGKGVKEVPVIFGYPQDLQNLDGLIAVSAGAGQEELSSIGFQEGTITLGRSFECQEKLVITSMEDGYAIGTVENEVLAIDGIEEVSSIGVDFIGNMVRFDMSTYFYGTSIDVGTEFNITYRAKVDDSVGIQLGFSAKEEVLISVLSANEATITCLDILVKACIITMRESMRDRLMTDLPRVSYTPIQPLSPEVLPDTPNLIFNRDYALVYTVSHNMDKLATKFIDSISLKNVKGGH